MLSKIRDLIQGYANYYSDLPPHITEQVQLRAFLCQDCAQSPKCNQCHCKVPEMFYSPLKVDSNLRWAEFMSKDQWNALKNNIHLYVEYFNHLLSTETAVHSSATGTEPISEQDAAAT